MNKEEFKKGFGQLVKAFTVQKPDDKDLIYFEKLSRLSEQRFLKTCNYIIENEDRFPSIMKILQVSHNFPDAQNHTPFECKDCSGDGLISLWNHGFRCRCLNGERISKLIPLIPETQDEKKHWYGKLNKEWHALYGKDLVEGKGYKGPVDLDIIEKTKREFGLM